MPWIDLVAERRPKAPQGVTPPENAADWYRIENSTDDPDATDIYMYDAIGGFFGMYADDFIRDLKEVTTSNINLRVNSPGGSVFEGIAIANAIRMHPANVTVYVDSLAASIASVIALAGNKLVMMPQSQLMIHDASGACYGNAEEMQKMADLLDKQSANIADAYATRAGGKSSEWRERMKDETWYSAKEAVAAGLADEAMVIPKKATPASADDSTSVYARMAASWDLSTFKYAGREKAPDPGIAAVYQPGKMITAQMTDGIQNPATSVQPGEIVVRLGENAFSEKDFLEYLRNAVKAAMKPDPEEEPESASEEEVDDAKKKKPLPAFLQPKKKDDEEDDEDEKESDNESDEEPEAHVGEQPASLEAGDGEPPTESPVDTGLGNAEETVESAETHDEWRNFADRLLNESPTPSADDVFNCLKEAWL